MSAAAKVAALQRVRASGVPQGTNDEWASLLAFVATLPDVLPLTSLPQWRYSHVPASTQRELPRQFYEAAMAALGAQLKPESFRARPVATPRVERPPPRWSAPAAHPVPILLWDRPVAGVSCSKGRPFSIPQSVARASDSLSTRPQRPG